MYIFSSTTNQIRRRLYPQENRLAWLFIRVPLCEAIDVCLIRESTSRIIPANWQWCMMANRNGIGAVETVRTCRDRLSAWLGAWESSPEISRWRHLKFRYAFGRSMSFFWGGRGGLLHHIRHTVIHSYTDTISDDCLSVWLFLLIGLSVSSVSCWVFWVCFFGCFAVAFVCRIQLT